MLSSEFKEQILSMSLADKLEVYELIKESISPLAGNDFNELDDMQKNELYRRASLVFQGNNKTKSWQEVSKNLSRK